MWLWDRVVFFSCCWTSVMLLLTTSITDITFICHPLAQRRRLPRPQPHTKVTKLYDVIEQSLPDLIPLASFIDGRLNPPVIFPATHLGSRKHIQISGWNVMYASSNASASRRWTFKRLDVVSATPGFWWGDFIAGCEG